MAFDINNPFGLNNTSSLFFKPTTPPPPASIVINGKTVGYDTGYSSVPINSTQGQQITQSLQTTSSKVTPYSTSFKPITSIPSGAIPSGPSQNISMAKPITISQPSFTESSIRNATYNYKTNLLLSNQNAVTETFVRPLQMDNGLIPGPVSQPFQQQFTFENGKMVPVGAPVSTLSLKQAEIDAAPAKVVESKKVLDAFGIETKNAFFSPTAQATVSSIADKTSQKIDLSNKYNDAQTFNAQDVMFSANLTQSLMDDFTNNQNVYSPATLSILEKNSNKYDLRLVGMTPKDTLSAILPPKDTLSLGISDNSIPSIIHNTAEGFYKYDLDAAVKNTDKQFGPIAKLAAGGIATGLSFGQGIVSSVHDFAWKETPDTPFIPLMKIPETNVREINIEANKANIQTIKKYNELTSQLETPKTQMNDFINTNSNLDAAEKIVNDKFANKYDELYNKNKQYLDTKTNTFIFNTDAELNTFNYAKKYIDDQVKQETGLDINKINDYSNEKDKLNKELFGETSNYNKILKENYTQIENPDGTISYMLNDFKTVDQLYKDTQNAYDQDKNLLSFTPKSEIMKVQDFTTREALLKYGTGEKGVSIFGVLPTDMKYTVDEVPFITPEQYKYSKDIFSETGLTPVEAEAKFNESRNIFSPLYDPIQKKSGEIPYLSKAIEKGTQKGLNFTAEKSLVPGFDKPFDIEINGLKVGETSFRQGAAAAGETLASTGESIMEDSTRAYARAFDKKYGTTSFEKMKESDIQASGQFGRIAASVAPLVAGTVIGGPAGAGIIVASSTVGAGESQTSGELFGNIATGAAFATASGGIRALGKYTEAAAAAGKTSKLTAASKVLGFAEKVAMPAYFGASTLIEGSKSIELARQGKIAEAEEMDRGLRAMLGGATLGAMGPGAVGASIVENIGSKITTTKYPTSAKEVDFFNPDVTKSGGENVFNMVQWEGKVPGNRFAAVLKYGKEKVKMFFYNDVGVKGSLKEKVPGLKEITEDQYFASIAKGPDIGKSEFISKQQPTGATDVRAKEGLLDMFFGTGQRYPVRYFENIKTGEKFGIAYTGYATGKTTYTDSRGIIDVLARKDTGLGKQTLGKDLVDYGGRLVGLATKTDIITPSKLYQNLLGDDTTYLLYSKNKLTNIKANKGESLRDFISRIKQDPANYGKQIINPAELRKLTGPVYDETASILISQGIDVKTGKFITGSKLTELGGQRTIIFGKDSGQVSSVFSSKNYIQNIGRFMSDAGVTSKLTYLTAKPVATSAATWEDVKKYQGEKFVEQMQTKNKKIDAKNLQDVQDAINITKLENKLKSRPVTTELTAKELAFKTKLSKMTPLEQAAYKPTNIESQLMESALQKQLAADMGAKKLTVKEEGLMQKILQNDVRAQQSTVDTMKYTLQRDLDKFTGQNLDSALRRQLRKETSTKLKENADYFTPGEQNTIKFFLEKDVQKFTGEKPRTDLIGKILGKTRQVDGGVLRQLRKDTSTKLKQGADYYTPAEQKTVEFFLKKDAQTAKDAAAIEAKLKAEGITGYEKGTSYLRDAGRAIIYDASGKKILMVKGKDGVWDFPGGGRNKGEGINYTVAREIFEETGLTPMFKKMEGKDVIGSQFADYAGRGLIQNRNILFEGTAAGTIKIKKGEITKAKYFTPTEILEKTQSPVSRTAQKIIATKEGYSERIFDLNPKITPYKTKPWDNPEYQQNIKITPQKSIPKWADSLPKTYIYSSTPSEVKSDVLKQISFTSSTTPKEKILTSSQKELLSDVYSQLSLPSATSSQKEMLSDVLSQVSSSRSSSSKSSVSSTSSGYSSSSKSYPSYSYPDSPRSSGSPSGGPIQGGPQGRRRGGQGKAPGKKQLIQVKSSLFRKFAFGEKDLLVDKESLAAFKGTISQKGTFFGYDSVPTQEQIVREEARLNKSQTETKGLKAEKSIFNIRV